MSENETTTRAQLNTCLQQQLDEFDMLSSIFCNPGELKIDDHGILADINQFIDGSINRLDQKLDYTISLAVLDNEKLEIHFELPHTYPQIETANIITIRSSVTMSSKAQVDNEIKQKIQEFIHTLDKSEVYVYQVIVWVQENCEDLFSAHSRGIGSMSTDKKPEVNAVVEMERLWIYSHHLKSKTKRQDIVQWAKDLDLSGFSRPGKPGIICVEGIKAQTQEFWKIIRQWSWHRITVRSSETKSKPADKIDTFRRFNGFREEVFTDIGDEDCVQPMDMSLFMKFLEQHNCKYIKKELFGFDG